MPTVICLGASTFISPSLARLYEAKRGLCDTQGVRLRMRAFARAHDQNVQFLCLGKFSVTTGDRGFIPGIHLHLGNTNKNQ